MGERERKTERKTDREGRCVIGIQIGRFFGREGEDEDEIY